MALQLTSTRLVDTPLLRGISNRERFKPNAGERTPVQAGEIVLIITPVASLPFSHAVFKALCKRFGARLGYSLGFMFYGIV